MLCSCLHALAPAYHNSRRNHNGCERQPPTPYTAVTMTSVYGAHAVVCMQAPVLLSERLLLLLPQLLQLRPQQGAPHLQRQQMPQHLQQLLLPVPLLHLLPHPTPALQPPLLQ